MRRLTSGAAGLGIALALAWLLLPPGSHAYRVRLPLSDAEGLRAGSAVVVGGTRVGKVSTLRLEQPGDRVVADLDLTHSAAPVGRDVTASIAAVNLLGQKEVQLTVGDRAAPAPSGFTIPSSRVVPSTDLDQVLNTLDPDTRARLAIFLNEAGTALGGRKGTCAISSTCFPGAQHSSPACSRTWSTTIARSATCSRTAARLWPR